MEESLSPVRRRRLVQRSYVPGFSETSDFNCPIEAFAATYSSILKNASLAPSVSNPLQGETAVFVQGLNKAEHGLVRELAFQFSHEIWAFNSSRFACRPSDGVTVLELVNSFGITTGYEEFTFAMAQRLDELPIGLRKSIFRAVLL